MLKTSQAASSFEERRYTLHQGRGEHSQRGDKKSFELQHLDLLLTRLEKERTIQADGRNKLFIKQLLKERSEIASPTGHASSAKYDLIVVSIYLLRSQDEGILTSLPQAGNWVVEDVAVAD